MGKEFIVISMYTPNTPYEEEIEELRKSCNRFNLKNKFYAIKNLGDWVKNTQQKANVIYAALTEFKEDVVWLDADAEILREPRLFTELSRDSSFHIGIYRSFYSKQKGQKRGIREAISSFLKRHRYPAGEIITNTIYVKNYPECKELINKWVMLNKQKVEWDQRTLQEILDADNSPYVVRQLPPEYAKIVPRGKKLTDIDNSKNIIAQKQLSRSAKKRINSV